jgi:hypothetical protein
MREAILAAAEELFATNGFIEQLVPTVAALQAPPLDQVEPLRRRRRDGNADNSGAGSRPENSEVCE